MKKTMKILSVLFFSSFLVSCGLFRMWHKPKEFTYLYDAKNTGLDKLLNIDGVFTSDSLVKGGIIFFKEGLVCNIKILSNQNIDYRLWGTYIIEDNIIKTQCVVDAGIDGLKINRDFYKIVNSKQIKWIGYISYHNLFFEKDFELFYAPLGQSVDISNCWLLKKKWFWTEEAWNKRSNK